jgi:hypothetical protein
MLDLALGDHLIVQTEMVGLMLGNFGVQAFPLVFVYHRTVGECHVDVQALQRRFLPQPVAEEEEEAAPF